MRWTWDKFGFTDPEDGDFPSSEIVDRILREIDIADLVSEFLDLSSCGRKFVGKCPWHNDTLPALQVDPIRNTWKCWVCDTGGDSISFLMKYSDLSIRAAVEVLAERLK